MRPSDHLLDFGRPVAYYPGLVKHFGSVNAVLFFCQIFYWSDKAHSQLGVYKSVEEIESETGLTYREQVTARRNLVSKGVLVETNKRLEHRIYYRIDRYKLDEILLSDSGAECIPPTAESAVREKQKRNSAKPKRADGEEPKAHLVLTEITTETTPEIIPAEAKATAAQKSVAVIKPMVIEAGGKQFEIPGDLKYPGAGTKSHRTWINYAIRYNNRYGTWPLWNRMTAGVVTSFIGRVGEEVAPRVAAFYLTVNDAYVVKQMHPFRLLLSGAETYHTQYVTNTSMTGTRARQIDQTQSNFDAVDEAMKLLEAREVKHANA